MLTELLVTNAARFLSGASVRWIDCQPDTCQRVYFANHTSHLDMVLVWSALPYEVLTADERAELVDRVTRAVG